MKKIELNIIVKSDPETVFTERKKHQIFLDWKIFVKFQDHRKALSYQNKLNIWLSATMYELNEMFATMNSIYQNLWLFCDDELEKAMENNIREFKKELKHVYHANYRGASGSFYVNKSTKALIQIMNNMNADLLKFARFREDWPRIYQIGTIKNQLARLQKEYGEIIDPGADGEIHFND